MRALIRGTEICLENAWTKWQRMNLLFLTGKEKDAEGNPLPGDGWTLVEDYQEPADDFMPAASHPADPTPAAAPEASQDTIVIDGVTYTRVS